MSYASHVAVSSTRPAPHSHKPPVGPAASASVTAAPKKKPRTVVPTTGASTTTAATQSSRPDASRSTHASASAAVFAAAAASSFAAASPSTPVMTAAPSLSPLTGSPTTLEARQAQDSFSEQDLLGSSHDYIYARRSNSGVSLPFFAALDGAATTPAASPSRSSPYAGFVAFDGLGRDRCDFKNQVECRVFNLRESMRDEFARLLRMFTSSSGFASAATPVTLEAAMSKFVSECHPVNFFWFSLEIFVDELLSNCWSGVGLESSRISQNSASLAHIINLHVRLTQPAATTNAGNSGERKYSGSSTSSSIVPSPMQAVRALASPRNAATRKPAGPTPTHTISTLSSLQEVISPASRFPPHLAFSFGSSSSSADSTALASIFPDRQEFFARFLLAANESGKLTTHIKNALVMKMHQLSDLSRWHTDDAGVDDNGVSDPPHAWRFVESAGVELARTWHGRILKLKLLAKFLSFISVLPQLDASRMATLGGNARGTGEDGLAHFDPSAALTNVIRSSANAMDAMTFAPFNKQVMMLDANAMMQPTPAFTFPLHLYLAFGRSTQSLSLFLPWICAFLRVLKFDLVQLQMEYHQHLLEELADVYVGAKRAMQAHREVMRVQHLASMQRTHSSPLITVHARPKSVSDASKPLVHLSSGVAFTPELTPLATPTYSSFPSPLTPHANVVRDDLNASVESSTFETDLTPPISPQFGSTTISPFLFFPPPPGSSAHASPVTGPNTSPTTLSAAVASSLARTQSLLMLEIEELFEWLELDIQVYGDEFERRKKENDATNAAAAMNNATKRPHIALPLSPVLGASAPTNLPQMNRVVHPLVAMSQVSVPRVAPRSLLGSLTSVATSTVVQNHAPVAAAVTASVTTTAPVAPSLPVRSSSTTAAPVRVPVVPTATSLDGIPNLVPNNLFLSLLSSSRSQSRKEEIRAIVNGDAMTLTRPRKDSAMLDGLRSDSPQTVAATHIKRTSSVTTRRKIAPIVDSSASVSSAASTRAASTALAQLRVDFFKRHADLSPIVRVISDNLERHVKDGHCIAQPVAERCQTVIAAFEARVAAQLKCIDRERDVAGLQQFLSQLHTSEQKMVRETVPPLVTDCLTKVTNYLSSSARASLHGLASPMLHPGVLQTAAHLTAQHSLASLRPVVTEKVRLAVKTALEKWLKKLRQMWTPKLATWATTATTAEPRGSNEDDVNAAPTGSITIKSEVAISDTQASREISTRIGIAMRCFQQVLAAAPPAAESSSASRRTTAVAMCRAMLQALMPLAICVDASQSTSALASRASLVPLQGVASETPSDDPSSGAFFERACRALAAVSEQMNPTSSTPSGEPVEYDQCWLKVSHLYRVAIVRAAPRPDLTSFSRQLQDQSHQAIASRITQMIEASTPGTL